MNQNRPNGGETAREERSTNGNRYRLFSARIRAPRRVHPYPMHWNLFIQQALNQERRRAHSYQPPPEQQASPQQGSEFNNLTQPSPQRQQSQRRNNLVLNFLIGEQSYQYTLRPNTNQNLIFEFFRNSPDPAPWLALNLNVISTIESLNLKSLAATEEDVSEQCTICISNFIVEQPLIELPCKHKFHKKCIGEWLVRTKACPLCRYDLSDGEAQQATEQSND